MENKSKCCCISYERGVTPCQCGCHRSRIYGCAGENGPGGEDAPYVPTTVTNDKSKQAFEKWKAQGRTDEQVWAVENFLTGAWAVTDEGRQVVTECSHEYTGGLAYHGHLDDKGKFVVDEIKNGVEKRLSDEAAKLVVSNVTKDSFALESTPPESWEEEFEKLAPEEAQEDYDWLKKHPNNLFTGFPYPESMHELDKDKVKSFITKLLSTERERVVKIANETLKDIAKFGGDGFVTDDMKSFATIAVNDIINKLTPEQGK